MPALAPPGTRQAVPARSRVQEGGRLPRCLTRSGIPEDVCRVEEGRLYVSAQHGPSPLVRHFSGDPAIGQVEIDDAYAVARYINPSIHLDGLVASGRGSKAQVGGPGSKSDQ